MISRFSIKKYARVCATLAGFLAASAAFTQEAVSPDRELYAVELGRSSAGRLFITPSDAPAQGDAGVTYVITGTVLSKATTLSVQMLFEVYSDAGDLVHTLDTTKEIESGATPFGFEWPLATVPDGDYFVLIRLMDPTLGEEAHLEQRIVLRNRSAVAGDVEQARALVTALHDSDPNLPASAQQQLRLAMEALAPYPSTGRPLIEADLNAHFASAVAGSVRAHLSLLPAKESSASPASAAVMRAGIVAHILSSPDRAAELGLTLAPYVITQAIDTAVHVPVATTTIPRIVWITSATESAEVPSQAVLAQAAALGNVSAMSLWTAPQISMQDESVKRDFQAYVRDIYRDRRKLNQAWNEHYFDFDEVEYTAFSDSRAYQFDAQAFRRMRTTRWLSDQLRFIEPSIAPAMPTITFTDGILLPAESRMGLDVESLAPLMPTVLVRTSGPLDDPRYAQRFPVPQLMWTLMHAIAPNRPLAALHSLDYTLADRLRLDSAAQTRTLAVEAAVDHVDMLALEFPALSDPVAQAPEAVSSLVRTLRELEGATDAVHALRDAVAPLAIVWSDSSKILNDGTLHLNAFVRAFEGCAFAGYKVGILTERQLAEGRWQGVRVVVLPEVTALSRDAFAGLETLIEGGTVMVRTEFGPTYDEHGNALGKTLPVNANTMLVRGNGAAYEYLSALDALHERGVLPDVPRPVTNVGYPVEGVKTRYAETPTGRFLYVVNLRKESVSCQLSMPVEGAADLLTGRPVDFPHRLDPLSPMLLRLADAAATTD